MDLKRVSFYLYAEDEDLGQWLSRMPNRLKSSFVKAALRYVMNNGLEKQISMDAIMMASPVPKARRKSSGPADGMAPETPQPRRAVPADVPSRSERAEDPGRKRMAESQASPPARAPVPTTLQEMQEMFAPRSQNRHGWKGPMLQIGESLDLALWEAMPEEEKIAFTLAHMPDEASQEIRDRAIKTLSPKARDMLELEEMCALMIATGQ